MSITLVYISFILFTLCVIALLLSLLWEIKKDNKEFKKRGLI